MDAQGNLANSNAPNGRSSTIPPRPPTVSSAVWTQLLRGVRPTREGSPVGHGPQPDISHLAPPLAPLDKNATSMRVLLHDTQSNFERFTVEVEGLFRSIRETKAEIKTLSGLYEKDRETLTSDIIDLVNRSQREVQRSVGEPAQAAFVERGFKDVHGALETINQRLDAIQSFNETHSRALQTQMQSIQIVLENQGRLITSVTPLLPLVQALPPHLETLRGSIGETVEKVMWKAAQETAAIIRTPKSRKRKHESFGSSENHYSPTHNKRLRRSAAEHTQEPEKRPRLQRDVVSPRVDGWDRQSVVQKESTERRSYDLPMNHTDQYKAPTERNSSSMAMPVQYPFPVRSPAPSTAFATPRRQAVSTTNSTHRQPPPTMRTSTITMNAEGSRPATIQDQPLRRLASAALIFDHHNHEGMPPPHTPGPLSRLREGALLYRTNLSDVLRGEVQAATNRQAAVSGTSGHPTPDMRHHMQHSAFPSPEFWAQAITSTGEDESAQASTSRPGLIGPGVRPTLRKLPSSTPKKTQKSLTTPLGQLQPKPGGSMSSGTPRQPTQVRSTPSIKAWPERRPPQVNIRESMVLMSGILALMFLAPISQQMEGRRFIPLVDSDDEIEEDDGP
ncbi:hypothetical protein CVT24_005659 [Panaeolus cyanescens]|uniref:Uncharacterized protein n=1 Tax=Panaeolus cyanescens TaxID=181874 RepID=A0A409V9J4_9AGAR|nr:hypothetical protein CVT24_005659 [Panaeolus cyanescens]